jgi:hypothetical protein
LPVGQSFVPRRFDGLFGGAAVPMALWFCSDRLWFARSPGRIPRTTIVIKIPCITTGIRGDAAGIPGAAENLFHGAYENGILIHFEALTLFAFWERPGSRR